MEKVVQDSHITLHSTLVIRTKLVFVDEPELADRPWQRETGGEIGRPLRYRMTGIFRTQADIDAETLDYSAIAPLLKPGDARVEDINGDGKITPADKTRLGEVLLPTHSLDKYSIHL